MRIARFTAGEDPRFGVVSGDIDAYGQLSEDAVIAELTGDPLYAGIQPAGPEHRADAVRLLAPVIPRSKIVAVGRNYAAHAAEMGSDVPDEPMVFLKPNTAVIGPGDDIVLPPQSADVQYEGELAVVIGRICKDVPAERAAEVIFGYTVANDVTARDLQRKDGRFSRAKGFDTFCPLGPWITTGLAPDHFAGGVAIQTHLDGDLVQDGSTADMVFDIPTLVAHISAIMTLLPGDVILTGTPEGVGQLHAGNEIEVSVAGLGALTNQVVNK